MKKLLTQKELCEMLCIKYTTLNRMMNDGRFDVSPINGRYRKLLFDPDAVEEWIKRQQTVIPAPTPPAQHRRDKKAFDRRQEEAARALERHRRNGKSK